jgi:Ser/Thr protein kinase RdoA (MazF antagonist)
MTNGDPQPASHHHLIGAVAAHFAVPVASVTVLTARRDRAVCTVITPNGRVVAKVSTTPHAFDGEAAAMQRLAGLGLPVSRVIDIAAGPPSLLVADFAEGVPVTADASPTIMAKIGELLVRLHRLPTEGPYSGHPTIEAWVTTWARDLVRWWNGRDDAPAAVIERTEQWLAAIQSVLASRTGTMILFDGRAEHFIVDDRGCVRMIDVADLMPGDPVMDLAVFELFAPASQDRVLAGYKPSSTLLAAVGILGPFYRYLRHLAGAEWKLRMGIDDASVDWHLTGARGLLDQHAPAS